MKHLIVSLCLGVGLFLDSWSYWRQIRKSIRLKKTSQVSSTSFILKIVKVIFVLTAFAFSQNYVGVIEEAWMGSVYVASLYVIIHYKPKNWRFWK